jgi:hypothetical protein
MLSRKSVCLACTVIALVSVTGGAALAQPLDKRTFFTFSGPVHMPGITLGSGTYLFRLADVNNRNVVQVLNADGTRLFGTFFTIDAIRPTPAEKPEVRFMETAASTPAPIQTWWYPGEATGLEFIYPKHEAQMMAKAAKQPVLTTQAQTSTMAETQTKDLSRIGSNGTETKLDSAAKPVSQSPTGGSQTGVVAPSTLVLPSNPAPVKAEPAPGVTK